MNGIYLYYVNKHLFSWALLGLQEIILHQRQNFLLVHLKVTICLQIGRKHCGSNAGLTAFPAFPTLFSKLNNVIKTCANSVRGSMRKSSDTINWENHYSWNRKDCNKTKWIMNNDKENKTKRLIK